MPDTTDLLYQLLDSRDEAFVRSNDWYNRLVENVTALINGDLNRLVNLLYRVDVSEEKLRSLLQHKPGDDAAIVIANLLLERQLEKIKQLKQFKQNPAETSDEEKW